MMLMVLRMELTMRGLRGQMVISYRIGKMKLSLPMTISLLWRLLCSLWVPCLEIKK